MMLERRHNAWTDLISFPLGNRLPRPRQQGLTMILDKGLGLRETRDLFNSAGQYVDLVKLGFGTTALYSSHTLEEKINLVRNYGADIYPGGTFLEVALVQNKLKQFLHLAQEMGFTCIEISDGTIHLPVEMRWKAITLAAEAGFKVLSEVGKKLEENLSVEKMLQLIEKDLHYGADKVILEGRESGVNVGLYDQQGNFRLDDLELLSSQLADPEKILWEAPQKDQQLELINRFGSNVNLGNIDPADVLALEALRVGLRADTLKTALERKLLL
ncbi:MAG: phosphosulfolactate synthase [Clostridia bacterium]|nr:phosphosulfolactate synthase [Clostridia bacterium]